jgi:hypothetical protein
VARIKEDVKRDALRYLEGKAEVEDGSDHRPFTVSAIARAIDAENQEGLLAAQLNDLQEEDTVRGYTVFTRAYVPTTIAGRRVTQGLAETGLLTFSPWASMFLAAMILLVGVSAFPSYINPARGAPPASINEAYVQGVEGGVLGVVVVIVVGFLIHKGIGRILRERHALADRIEPSLRISKWTLAITVVILLAWFLLGSVSGRTLDLGAIVAVVGLCASISSIIYAARHAGRKRNRRRVLRPNSASGAPSKEEESLLR